MECAEWSVRFGVDGKELNTVTPSNVAALWHIVCRRRPFAIVAGRACAVPPACRDHPRQGHSAHSISFHLRYSNQTFLQLRQKLDINGIDHKLRMEWEWNKTFTICVDLRLVTICCLLTINFSCIVNLKLPTARKRFRKRI